MTTRECYEIMDADYEDVLRRLMSDRLVLKFNLKFQNATDYRQSPKFVTGERRQNAI